jgi:transcription initiation factor TFIID subunit TAF12
MNSFFQEYPDEYDADDGEQQQQQVEQQQQQQQQQADSRPGSTSGRLCP